MDLSKWLRSTTPAQRNTVAGLAGTTQNYLYQMASGHRHGSADLAAALESAAAYTPGVPELPRGAVCATCRTCPHYIKAP